MEACEAEYYHLMEEEFLLKYHGHFSLFEMNNMTAEDRAWHIDRINKEVKAQNSRSTNIGPKGRAMPPGH